MFGFRKNNNTPSIENDFSVIGVDFHSHLVPGVDDGCSSIEESIEIIQALSNLGYQKIITTPHIMGDGYTNNSEGLKTEFEHLQKAVLEAAIPVKMGLSAEYFLDDEMKELIVLGDLMPIGNRFLLVETSTNYEFPQFKELLFLLQNKKYKVVLAHPERYRFFYEEETKWSDYEQLKDSGIYFQLNLFSLVGLYGQKTQRIAEEMIEREWYDFACTDLHKPSQLNLLESLKTNIHLHQLISSGLLKNRIFLSDPD